MLDLAEARRRRTRWRFLATAAAVVAIAGGLFAGLSSATSTTVTRTVIIGGAGTGTWDSASGTNQATRATATVAYSHQLWGNAFQVLVNRIPIGTTCQMWVVHPDGSRTQVAAWTTAPDEGRVLRFLSQDPEPMTMTCIVSSDLDNYARLTCVWLRQGSEPAEPGLEAMFPTAEWPDEAPDKAFKAKAP